MNALGIAYASSDDSDSEDVKSNLSISSKSSNSSAGITHQEVTEGHEQDLLQRTRLNSIDTKQPICQPALPPSLPTDLPVDPRGAVSQPDSDDPMEEDFRPKIQPKSQKVSDKLPSMPSKFYNAQEFASFIRQHKSIDLDKLLPEEPNNDELHVHIDLQQNISKMIARKNHLGYSYIDMIEKNKNFKNPSIYEKLIEHHDIDECGTNFTPDIFNPRAFDDTCYYDQLRAEQATYMCELEKKKSKDRKKDKEPSNAVGKRVTKWDK